MREFDVIILGAGIAGASLAYRLAPQRRVLLLERESQPGYHSTGRSAAMFMASYGPPMVRALTRASRAFYAAPPAGFAEAPLMTPRPVLYIGAPGQSVLLAETAAALEATGTHVERIGADEALRHVPCLRPDQVEGALVEDDAADLDVHALHQGFLRGAKAAGAQLQCGAEPRAAAHDGERWTLTLADGDAIAAPIVVDAAGAWADEAAALFGAAPLGLQPRRRSAFTFDAPAGVDPAGWPAVVAADETWYFKPDAGRLLGSPANADDTVPHDVVPEELDIALGIHLIETATTMTIRRPASTWAGLRTFAPDGEIVIGFDDARPGFFWLAGQGGYGIQSAAGASALAAALITGAPLPETLAAEGVDPAAVAPARLRAR